MYNFNGVKLLDYSEILEISQQRLASQTERFRRKNVLDVWSTHSSMKQAKSKHSNRIAHGFELNPVC